MNKTFYRLLCLFLTVLACFSGCFSGLDDSSLNVDSKNFITVSGSLRSSGAVPSRFVLSPFDSFRTAFPSEQSSIFYEVKAVKKTDSNEIYEATITGLNFSIKLTKGTWILTAKGYSDSAKTKEIFSGSTELTLGVNETIKTGISINLTAKNLGEGKGTVRLVLEKDSSATASKIAKVLASWNDGSQKSQYLLFDSYNQASFNMGGGEIKSGAYSVCFTFYDSEGGVLFFCSEVVNVFGNMETNRWISSDSSASPYLKTSGGTTKFFVTGDLVKNFVGTTFYVNGAGGNIGTQGSDSTGNGGYFSPFATVYKAAKVIENSPKDSNTEFTVYVSGKTLETRTIEIKKNTTIKKIDLDTTNATLERKSDFTTGSMIKVDSNAKLTMNNITLDGKDIEISVPSAGSCGGGIFALGEVDLNNCTIKNFNFSTTKNSFGGAIAFAKKSKLTNCTIQGCKAKIGGAILVGVADGASIVVEMNGGEVKNCSAFFGGGVFVNIDCTFKMTDATIFSCHSLDNKPSGVYLESNDALFKNSTITLNGSSKIGSETDKTDIIVSSYTNGTETSASKIKIETELSQNFVAHITPSTYKQDVAIIDFGDNFSGNKQNLLLKFKVNADSSLNPPTAYTLELKNGKGVLVKQGLTTTFTGPLPYIVSVPSENLKSIVGNSNTVSVTVKKTDNTQISFSGAGNANSISLSLLQNGNVFFTNASQTDKTKITIPAWLQVGLYELRAVIKIEGNTYDYTARYEVTAD
ncbi:hypothetical protein [Treponema pectinovorum]|uniref:hypothetical protein n=1 Tax=Treponema pectinovorum TaxID=164 RepID=UPI0011C96E13|nr:hypothetical protein [Treponema pectinovorum]